MIMNSRFLLVLMMPTALHMVLLHMSLVHHLLAFNPEAANVTTTTSVKCIDSERQSLLSLKQGFELDNASRLPWNKDWLASWGDGENQKECCSWKGVQCSNETGHVIILDLHPYNDLVTVSSISPSLGELHHLNYLDLSFIYTNYTYTESTFDIIGSLTLLRHLNLSYCGFQGTIPRVLGNLLQLEYLDLRGNTFNESVPPFLGNLFSLKYLDLSDNDFIGTIPVQFGNLSNLQYLDLSSFYSSHLSSDLQWLSHLSSLRHLSLFGVNLSTANSWQRLVSDLSHLQYLNFHACDLLDSSPPSSLSPSANFSTSLSFVDISNNHLMDGSLIFPWLMNSTSSLSTLRMNNNILKGTIPEAFRNLSSLEELNLADNFLDGQILVSLFSSCKLRVLDLTNNMQKGQFHDFVQALSHCAHKPSLQTLKLGWNEITGMVCDLSGLSSLEVLDLNHNGLNGTIHEGIGKLSKLVFLRLGNNKLEGSISEAHFLRLSSLENLDLSRNQLVFNVSSEWVPPSNLTHINLASCNLGPDFPRWLRSLQEIYDLDISQAEISSTVPNWFWEYLPHMTLNISHNYMRGEIKNIIHSVRSLIFIALQTVDLSSNLFEGSIPTFFNRSSELFLSNNLFSSADLLLCSGPSSIIRFLDLSNNSMRGELPDCWMHFESLVVLDLSENQFHGNIPTSMGSLRNMQSLHLSGNKFSGEIPSSLMNCTELVVFFAAENRLSGILPSWIGDNITKLQVLSLRSNKFHGSMPLSICNLGKLHILDLSLNYLSGNIPKCISNLSAMATPKKSNATINHDYETIGNLICRWLYGRYCDGEYFYTGVYNDSASLIWKGEMSKYGSTLGLLTSIDFSSNNLVGEIPIELTNLVGLVSLNISRNMLSGEIPQTIGQLKSVDSLDLSRNYLSGMIPSQLAQLDRLSVLDLSYNDLSGEIPVGTQLQARDASAYVGNPKLCGAPLNTCPIPGHQVDENDTHIAAEQFFTNGIHIAIAIGFVTGFWGVCFSLIFNKSWRCAYFKFWSDAYGKLYVWAAIKIAKLQMNRS